ncbi:hypothetical protein AMR72_10450 [Flavobacterium psychrophilum]|nr:hypothetical protein AMR72_10450 [Flavobacterium psychrophilum]AOE52890.1 hypothetical protein ALW18_10440 [Flavobacterium psychrophilum]
MKKITLMIFVSLMSFFAYAQLPEYQFEDAWTGSPAAPPNWIVINEHGPTYTWARTVPGIPTQPPYGGTGYSAYIRREEAPPTGAIPTDWLVSSAFPMVNNAELRFQSRLFTEGDQGSLFRIYIVKDTGNPADMTVDKIQDEGVMIFGSSPYTESQLMPGQQTVWKELTYALPANTLWPAGTNVRVAFVMEGNFKDQWFIDNVKVSALCIAPTGVSNTAATDTTATFTWTDAAASNKWEVAIAKEIDAVPTSGDIVMGPLPYTKTGLEPCTDYKVFVRSVCPDGGTSPWTNVLFFSTRCLGETCALPIVIPPANAYTTTDNTANYADMYEATGAAGCNTSGNYLSGNDAVYSYTPGTSGNYNIEIKNGVTSAGVFVFASCANLSQATTGCLNGAVVTSSSAGGAKIASMPLDADTTYIIVVSSGSSASTTPYRLTIQQVFCTEPTLGVFNTPTSSSATLTWTKAATSIDAWQVAVQPLNSGLPTGNGVPVTGTPSYNATQTVGGQSLQPATTYEFYVRETCPGGTSYSPWAGPFLFSTTQIPTGLPYLQNFENGNAGMSISNGLQTNVWKLGTDATTGITSNSLFITNNNTTNEYTTTVASTVHAYRDIQMPGVIGQLSLSFDWRGIGESSFDRLKVWMVPASYVPVPGTQITTSNGMQIGGNFSAKAEWSNSLLVFNAPAAWNGAVMRLVFEWRNDTFTGTQPPVAIDNINLSLVTCPQPTALTLDSLAIGQAVVKWTAPAIVPPTYDLFVTTDQAQVPTTTTVPSYNGIAGTTYTIPSLIPSTAYYVYVRAHCSDTDTSYWTGPLTFYAPQIPADMDYSQNFDTGAHGFTLNNGTQPNKWYVGTATSNSPSSSLYISDTNGTTNTYNVELSSVTHAYRDIKMPQTIPSNQVSLTFDWKANGEGTSDRLRVWLVPITFTPTAGTAMGASSGQLIGSYSQNGTTWSTVSTIFNATDWPDTTKRLVFEWINDSFGGSSPAAAIDNINLKVVSCPAPTGLTIASTAPGSASFTWTAPAGTVVPEGYQYYYNTTGVPPTDATEPIGSVTGVTTATISGFGESINYTVWIRSNCGSGGTSLWAPPVSFLSPQTPATIDYSQNFDTGAHNWALSNGTQVNKWIVGSDTSNSAPNSLYISSNGSTNTYNINQASVVHAYRDVIIPDNSDQLLLQFDWKSIGEINDYFRVWLVPASYSPVPGTQITATNSGGGIPIDGGNFTGSTIWKTRQSIIGAASFSGQVRRLVFEWRNNGSNGDQSPAAIDNIKLSVVKCPQPLALALTSNTTAGTTFTWSPPASGAPASYDYYYTSSATLPTEDTVESGNTSATTVTLNLPNSTNYFFYVRSNCGGDGTSIWTGPINFNTPQVPVNMPYAQYFEEPTHGFALSSGAQVDKWYYGTATSSSATHSLYISNDGGVTNNYTITTANVSHVYRDINIPAGTTQLDIAFDWRAAGQTAQDYLRAWFVPATFEPVPGTQIVPANGIQIGTNYNQKAEWTHADAIITLPAAYQGQTGRIVFEWKANNSTGAQPAGAVDNIEVKAYSCPKPTALVVDQVGVTTARLNWEEQGTASQWEVYAVPVGSPIPTTATVGEIASSKPYVLGNLQGATNYQFYVRAICGPGDKSRWSGPIEFRTTVCEVEEQCVVNFILTDGGGDGWNTNTITVSQGGFVVGVLGPQITGAGPTTVTLTLCKGLPYEVFWGPDGYDSDEIGLEIVNPFNGQTVFRRPMNTLNSDQNTLLYTGIAFCEDITCPQPVSLASKNVVNAPNTTELSWTPGGAETQWEIVVQVQGTGFPAAPGSTPEIISVSEPSYTYANLTPSTPYEFYVRAICGTDDQSYWSGPLKFSIFTPPACADVVVLDKDLEIIAPDTEYLICSGEDVCVDFSANYFTAAAETTSYSVESIPFNPPFPTLGGTSLPVGSDDIWSPKIDLPFEFCFYGNSYNSAQVGANGLVSFNVDHYSGEGSGYIFPEQAPNTDFVEREISNAIYGVMQDTDPSIFNYFTAPNINYQVLGNYPCRALVVSFNELAQYGCNSDETVGAQSSQIIIYEVTNIIEVYVKRRVPCNAHQAGRGIIGIQNATGTAAVIPPGRNTGNWSVLTPEAWRFTPNGTPTVNFEWLKNGESYSTDKDINVCGETGTTVMTARATYSLCNGETIVRESEFSLTVTEQIVPDTDPVDITKCGNGGEVTVELTDAVADLFANPAGYDVTFFATEQNAIDNVDNIPSTFVTDVTTTIWVRVSRGTEPCFITRSFQVIVSNQGPVFTITPDVSICEGSTTIISVTPGDFNETEATYEWTLDGVLLPDVTRSITVSAAGEYKVVVTKNECESTATTTVTVVPLPVADTQPDVTECESYLLPVPSANNSYYTAPGGTTGSGTLIDPTQPITATQSIYVYAVSTDLATCTSESSFIVTIEQKPVINTSTEDVLACGTYTLPAPAANEVYYTATGGPNGFGTIIDITTPMPIGTYEIFVYEESVSCSAEDSFIVKVSQIPTADAPADEVRCDAYVLPALSFQNEYRTQPGGQGDVIAAGTSITSTQTIYVYAFIEGNTNCFAESEFTVTITPTPAFNLGGPYNVCQPSNAVINVNNANFTDADVTYEWTLNGNPIANNTGSLIATEFGTYSLTVTRGDCVHTESVEVVLNNTSFDLGFTDGCDGNTYSVEVVDVNGSFNIDTATYSWSGPGGFTATDREIFPKVIGDYTVVVTSADGCVSEDVFPVISTTCDIPRGISPNNDGLNDNFDLSGLGVKKLVIFNRYGQEVYSRNNYKDEWHGQGRGSEELPTGTYFYMVERTNGESKTGWVYINREE